MSSRWYKNVCLSTVYVSFLFVNICLAAPSKQYDITTSLGQENIETTQDTDVLALEHLKNAPPHAVAAPNNKNTLPALQKQLETETDDTEFNETPILPHNLEVHDVENPVNEKPTTITSHVKNEVHMEHIRPETPPFDETSLHEKQENNKPTPKSYLGAARLTGCATCGQDHPISPEKSSEEDALPFDATSNGQKRISLNNNGNVMQNTESLMKQNNNGQYSASDLAQYIFWTGDEAGVAKAIEELIDAGLLSREAALVLLKDIHTATDDLQNTYTKEDTIPVITSKQQVQSIAPLSSSTIQPTLSPIMSKILEALPNILKINEVSDKKDSLSKSIDYDESTGRLRLADFLYAEYSLEEVIYQLAKVMFTQSLNQGSEEAQVALQRLTSFLEMEGQQGRISPALQKKVLDVLLAALSDTLHESPELMAAAKQALGAYLNQIPKHKTYKN